jgi:SAM-dependent methyltransferase
LVPKPGKLTIDVGCGEGRVSRDLQDHGHKMLGFDLSRTMCQATVSHPATPCSAVQSDAAKLPLADNSVDCAIAFMSLQDIDDMSGAISEIGRVLKDGSSLALAIVHPLYSGGGFSENEDLFVLKRSYFKAKRLVSRDAHGDMTVTFFREHRPLQTYTRSLIEAGFNIEQLIELTDTDASSGRESVPMFLDILATRRPRKNWLTRFTPIIYTVSGLIVGALAILATSRLHPLSVTSQLASHPYAMRGRHLSTES